MKLNILLKGMEGRLGMYIGCNDDFGRMCSFINGTLLGKEHTDSLLENEKEFRDTFYDYVKKHYKVSYDIFTNWEDIIFFHAGKNGKKAIEEFFKLYKIWHKERFGEYAW